MFAIARGKFVEPRTAFVPDDAFAETTSGQTAIIAWLPDSLLKNAPGEGPGPTKPAISWEIL
jgi:hypothetical protein